MHHRFRSSRFCCFTVAIAFLALASSCKKKETNNSGGDPNGTPATNVSTDYLVFAHLNAKQLRGSPFFTEMKDAFAKEGEQKSWDELEKGIAEKIGMKPTQIDSVTVVVTGAPDDRGPPPVIMIMVANAPISQQTIFGAPARPSATQSGFFDFEEGLLAHFPDDKTLVLVHRSLAEAYLGGYAKDRSGWPLNSDLISASKKHTMIATINPAKLPTDALGRAEEPFLPLLKAKSATLTIDLNDREIAVGLRGKFDSSDAAMAAKIALDSAVNQAVDEVASAFKTPRDMEKIGSALPLIKEAHRALAEAKISVSGSEVTASTVYKVEFNLFAVLKDAVDKVRNAAARAKSQNNLKQVGIAIHNYASANGGDQLILHGVGKNGEQVRTQVGKNGELIFNPKPLLSWRVAILPYIEQANLYNEFKHDEPWDSEHNKKLISRMPKIFEPTDKKLQPGMTHLQQIIGPTCMQPGRFNIGNIPDGTSNTVAVVEAANPVTWTKPDDVTFAEKEFNAPPPKDLKKLFGGYFENGMNVLMWDGSVQFIDLRFVSDKTLWNALQPADGQVLGSDWWSR